MAAVLIAILSLTVLGIPIALALDRSARGPLLLGAAFLYGVGAVFLVLLVVPWKLPVVAIALLALAVGSWRLGVRQKLPTANRQPATLHVIDLLTLVPLAGYAGYATIARLWEWDFWAIWGLKARVFLEHGGIDWRFLESRWNTFVHPDYPLLLPLNYVFLALAQGGWDDRWLGILFVAFGVAILLIARGLAARETPPLVAALLTFALASIAASRYVGLAEGALIAFGGAAVLFAREALLRDDPAAWPHAAVMLGLAANCKNEGLALLVAVTLAVLIVRAHDVLRLWPAYVLAAPWIVMRMTHDLATDIVEGSAIDRMLVRARFMPQVLRLLAENLYEAWFWVALLAGLMIVPHAARVRERFVLLVTAVQMAFYVGSYLVTPHDIRWHVKTSWPRLTEQLAVPITFVVFLLLADLVRRREDAPHAEARPEQ
jgi:hypothetical protein